MNFNVPSFFRLLLATSLILFVVAKEDERDRLSAWCIGQDVGPKGMRKSRPAACRAASAFLPPASYTSPPLVELIPLDGIGRRISWLLLVLTQARLCVSWSCKLEKWDKAS